jgi:hypothetical protein
MAKAKEEFFTSSAGHPKDRIIVHESADYPPEGLFVGLNGVDYHIPAGVEIELPRPVRKMLDTRIRTESRTINKGPGQGVEIHKKNIPRVTYTMIQENVGAVPDPAPAA